MPGRNNSDKLLILGEEIPPCSGGVAQWGYWLGRKLHERGFRVIYAARVDYAQPKSFYGDAFEVYPIPADDWRHHKDRHTFGALWKIWRLHRPALILCLTWKQARIPLLLRRLTGWRVAVIAHGMEITKRGSRLRRRLALRWIFGSADLSLAVSRYTRERVAEFGVAPEAIEILPCGVDADRFVPGGGAQMRHRLGLEGLPVVLTLSRLVARKGHELVIEALQEVRRHVPNAKYVVAGSGNEGYLQRLHEMTREKQLEDAVHFLGHAADDDLPSLYSASDVYVMPSRISSGGSNFEGFGITYLEANACGVPVIGADTGGVADAIVDGETGYLVAAGDVRMLEDRIVRLLRDPALARRLGENGRARVLRSFTWDHLTECFLDLLEVRCGPIQTRRRPRQEPRTGVATATP
ncbi:MAG: glycosyltransferase family 4 protein [Acidobacteriota bacterium]